MRHRQRRPFDARRVAPDDEERSAARSSRGGVELDLRRPAVDHGRGPDAHDRPGRIQHALVEDGLVLFDSHVERHVVGLRPAAQRREPQDRILVAHLDEALAARPHEVRVARVRRVSRLESEDDVRALRGELVIELFRRFAPPVEAVVVGDAVEELDFAAEQPVAARHDAFDVRVAVVDRPEAPRHDLLLAVRVDLEVVQLAEDVAVLVD
mmetsp:Transcript_18092/g.56484  ORF Transcript_18092/g.56484 Transcript_18092/m.56484 type:complete len:210 (-) Transcript_18092:1307-1936(-)